MGAAKYDQIGIGYSTRRKTDPFIAEQLYSRLKGADRILNIGAGTGSYEPSSVDLIAVEPSAEMIAQRSLLAYPAIQASAEQLPFDDNTFSHSMTVLSMHHWPDRDQAFSEISRVTRDIFVAITWDVEATPFWLTRDYFPEIYEKDQLIFPTRKEFEDHFDEVTYTPLLIPENCEDGFTAAYWKRPEAYLKDTVRRSISTFGKIQNVDKGLEKLKRDLENGSWQRKNEEILQASSVDVGYVIVRGKIRKPELNKDKPQ